MDMENDENCATEDQRKKLFNYFMKVVMPVGNERTSFLYVGSILSYASLLNTVLTDPKFNGWDRRIYQAVIEESTNAELWQEWENIYTNLSDKHASKTAFKFYKEHEKEMLDGVILLWPEWKKDAYYKLMVKKLEDSDAFYSEYQNCPLTEDSRVFKEAWLNANTYETLPEITEIYGAVDPSMGKNKRSDTSAIIMLGKGVDNYFYVLAASICRRSPDDIIQDITYMIAQYKDKLKGFVVETNVFAEFFATTLKKKFVDMGIYVNWIEDRASQNKDARISAMSTSVKHGYIKFNKHHTVLWNQLKNYPKSHDDGPDALEKSYRQFLVSSNSGFCFTSLALSHPKTPQSQLSVNSLLKSQRRW